MFSGDYGVVKLEVGGEVNDISISKDIKYEVDMKLDEIIGQYFDVDVVAENM